MSKESFFKIVQQIVHEQSGNEVIEKITPETRLVDDLGLDSLDIVEIVLSIEDETGRPMPEDIDGSDSSLTVQQLVDALGD